jgi:hypothetical protein
MEVLCPRRFIANIRSFLSQQQEKKDDNDDWLRLVDVTLVVFVDSYFRTCWNRSFENNLRLKRFLQQMFAKLLF